MALILLNNMNADGLVTNTLVSVPLQDLNDVIFK